MFNVYLIGSLWIQILWLWIVYIQIILSGGFLMEFEVDFWQFEKSFENLFYVVILNSWTFQYMCPVI